MADSGSNPLTAGASLGAGVGGSIGSLIGYFLSQGDRDTAMKLLQQATQQYQGLNPNVAAQQANADPQAQQAQLQALQQLRQIYQAGGMDAQTKADQATTTAQANANAQALNKGTQNQMARRGLSSSGMNYAMQQGNNQNAENTAYLGNLQAQAAGEGRAMNALQSAGQLGNAYGAQQDAISQFNASQRQNAQQQTFNNSYSKANGVASGYGAQAQGYLNQGRQTEDAANGAGSAVGAVGGALASLCDERLKTNVVRLSDEAMPGVPLSVFEYRHEPGQKYLGVIAQDLEKVAPHLVSHDESGLKYVHDFPPLKLKG